MKYAAGLVAGHHIQIDRVNAVENAALDVGIVAAQTAQQELDLLTLGAAAAIVSHGAVFGKAAGALDKCLPRGCSRADESAPCPRNSCCAAWAAWPASESRRTCS